MLGYLRETEIKAIQDDSKKKSSNGIIRTGLDTYLKVIFPEVTDWVHDKAIPNVARKFRPDYRSEQLNLLIDFDGLPHYTQPHTILADENKRQFYESLGYKYVTIPFFIQLTNSAVKTLFNVDVKEELFDETVPSLFAEDFCTPAYLCPLGIKRMAKDFKNFPEQYEVNMKQMKTEPLILTGWNLLEKEYLGVETWRD